MRSILPSNVSFPTAQRTSLQHLNSRADTSVVSLQQLQVHLQIEEGEVVRVSGAYVYKCKQVFSSIHPNKIIACRLKK